MESLYLIGGCIFEENSFCERMVRLVILDRIEDITAIKAASTVLNKRFEVKSWGAKRSMTQRFEERRAIIYRCLHMFD
jgi:hypothetical protein